jgi:hypothetical protein
LGQREHLLLTAAQIADDVHFILDQPMLQQTI